MDGLEILSLAQRLGFITEYNSATLQYKCSVCNVSGSGDIKAHLTGSQHINAAAWHIVKQIKPSQELLEALPDAVRQGKIQNDVHVHDKAFYSFRCNICTDKKPLSGLNQLEDHLIGGDHKKKKLRAVDNMEILSLAQRLGFITECNSVTLQYKCSVCNVSRSGDVKAHLNGSQHINAAAWHIVEQIQPSQDLLQALPDAVRQGKIQNDIKVDDKAFYSFRCNICTDKKPITGLVSLEAHLVSGDHLKKKLKTVHNTQGSTTSSDLDLEILSLAKRLGFITTHDIGTLQYKCSVCSVSRSGDVKAHLSGSQHINAAAWYILEQQQPSQILLQALPDAVRKGKIQNDICVDDKAFYSFRCNICTDKKPLSGLKPLEDHLTGKDHQKKKLGNVYNTQDSSASNQTSPPRMSLSQVHDSDAAEMENLSPDASVAIQKGIITISEKLARSTSYKCNACSSKLTGLQQLEDHVIGKSHIKKASMVSDARKISTEQEPEPILHTPSNVQSDCYKVTSNPRGLVHIFNNSFDDDCMNVRSGSQLDAYNIHKLFDKMGYKAKLYPDYTRDETMESFKKIQSDHELNHVDALILVILSHGYDTSSFYGNDMKPINIDEVRYMFTDSNCPALKGKPKIILLNFCRGLLMEKLRLVSDAPNQGQSNIVETPRDMITIYASIDGIKAMRDPIKGTIFAQSLYKVLKENATTLDLNEIYLKMCEDMEKKNGTTPEIQNYRFKKFFFNPK